MSDFEEIFGKTADKMTEGEFKMAVLGTLHEISERLDNINGKVKCIPRHDKMIWAGTTIIPFIVGWLIYISKQMFGIK